MHALVCLLFKKENYNNNNNVNTNQTKEEKIVEKSAEKKMWFV